jgi:hypothetical protein
MLNEVTLDGGLGFCHEAVPTLLPAGYHGPLIVALDSNILIDLEQHGEALINGQDLGVQGRYGEQLSAIGAILEMWMLRDIRFIVTPRLRTDAKRPSAKVLSKRGVAIAALAESLAFQLGDWTVPPPSERRLAPVGAVAGLPAGADRDLLLEAHAVGAHVFLTRDDQVIKCAKVTGPAPRIMRPKELADALSGVQLFVGGLCSSGGECPYADFMFFVPDTGKWRGLLSVFAER